MNILQTVNEACLPSTQSILIELRGINKFYNSGSEQNHVLKQIDFTVNEGDFVSIMGPSGSGKSTFINVLGFLDNKFDGDYLFKGVPLDQKTDKQIAKLRNQMVGFIFQDFNLISSMNVADNIRLPLLYKGLKTSQTHQQVQEVLKKVGLADYGNRRIHELSGGQKQRIAIARALVNQPQFIIADEPTGALDTKTSAMIMEILAQLHQEGITIVMVTHDPSLQVFANRHVVIVDGQMTTTDLAHATDLSQRFNQMQDLAEEEAYEIN